MDAYPLVLLLPNKARAQLVPGSAEAGRPVYELNGSRIEVDVRIPGDLAGRWYWRGSMLAMNTGDGEPALLIDPGTYPPPGIEAVRGSCFDVARAAEATGARIEALSPERPAKKRHASRAEPQQERTIEVVQMEMEW